MTDFKNIANYLDFIEMVVNHTGCEQLTTVLPDNSVILGFQLGQQVYEKFDYEKETMTSAGVCGPLTKKKVYLNTPNSQTILVKFKPWSAGLFFDWVENMTNHNTDLAYIVPRHLLQQTQDYLHHRKDKLDVVKSFLLKQFAHKNIDRAILKAIGLTEKRKGKIRVDELAYQVYNSKRNFERKFKSVTGLTPKKFIANTRFQYAVKHLQSTQDLQEVAFLSGYYDLPHFINHFKSVTGTTPGKFAY